MWPARCACSCGRWAGASSRPAYSSGLRTSTRFLTPIASTVSSRNARIEVSCSCAVYDVFSRDGRLVRELAAVELPLLAAAVEQLHVLVAVELEVPVGVRGEPVVVAAVQHHGAVVGDTAVGEQRLELLLVDEVTAHLVLQVRGPVELDRSPDVALVVRRGVLVDLDQHHLRVVEVLLHPLGGDERVVAAHVITFSLVCSGRVVVSRCSVGVVPGPPAMKPADQQVHLAAQAEPNTALSRAAARANPVATAPTTGAPARKPASATSVNTRPTPCANRGGAGSSSSAGGASRGRTTRRKSTAYGPRWTPRPTPTANRAACTASSAIRERGGAAAGRARAPPRSARR